MTMTMTDSLAKKTYDAMGADNFLEYLKTLTPEDMDLLFNDCFMVDPWDEWNDRGLYLIVRITEHSGMIVGYLDNLDSYESVINDSANTLYCLGQKELAIKELEKGTYFVHSYEEGAVPNVGVKVDGWSWEISGVERIYSDLQMEGVIESYAGTFTFYFDGEVVLER